MVSFNSATWSWMPVSVQSQVASFKRSFSDSKTFFKRFPWTSLASNMMHRSAKRAYNESGYNKFTLLLWKVN